MEDLRIGTAEGAAAYVFTPRPVVTVRADGTIYVADQGTKNVRAFDARGRHVRTFGRQGAGPGEFLAIGEAGWVGDTLWVTDPMQLRATLFTPEGRVVRTLGPVTRATAQLAPAGAWALLSDGSVLARPSGRERSEAGEPLVFRLPLLRVDPRTGGADTLDWRALRTRMLRVDDAGRLLSILQPWDDSPLFAVAPDGRAIVRVERALASGGDPVFRVTRFAPDGRRVYARSFRYEPVRIPREWRSRWAATMARNIDELRPAGNVRALAEAIAREVYVPAAMPPVSAVVVGSDGTVWLRREAREGPTVDWLVLDGAGRMEATVRLPSSLDVHQAVRSHVWGVAHDDLDVPFVLRFRIAPPRRR